MQYLVDGSLEYRDLTLAEDHTFGAGHIRNISDRVIARRILFEQARNEWSDIRVRHDDLFIARTVRVAVAEWRERRPNRLLL